MKRLLKFWFLSEFGFYWRPKHKCSADTWKTYWDFRLTPFWGDDRHRLGHIFLGWFGIRYMLKNYEIVIM